MAIPSNWPQPDPGGGWSYRAGGERAWWAELPPMWAKRFTARGLPVVWAEARKTVSERCRTPAPPGR